MDTPAAKLADAAARHKAMLDAAREESARIAAEKQATAPVPPLAVDHLDSGHAVVHLSTGFTTRAQVVTSPLTDPDELAAAIGADVEARYNKGNLPTAYRPREGT